MSGPSPSNEIKPSGYHEGCALLAARCMRTPLPRVPPPDRVYMYSLEIALRLAHIRKIHLYFSTHRPLSARCDPSRVSCIPPRACAATCIAPNAPRGPHSSMTTCRAVCLCDHVCRRNTTSMPIPPEPLSCTTSVPPPHHHACTALWPRVWLRDRVPQQNCPCLFNTHRSHR